MGQESSGIGFYVAIFVSLFLIGIGALYLVSAPESSLSERIKQTGTIRLAYAPEAPYAFLDANGKVTGAWPEVARKVLARMGVPKTEWVQCEFGALLDDLNIGRFDLVAMGMSITPAREEIVHFSQPVWTVRQGLIIRRGNPKSLMGYADAVRNKDARVAVLKGAIEVDILKQMGMPEQRLVILPDARSAIAALKNDNADGLALTLPTAQYLALSDPTLDAVPAFAATSEEDQKFTSKAAYAFRKADKASLQEFNKALEAFMRTPEFAETVGAFGFIQEPPAR